MRARDIRRGAEPLEPRLVLASAWLISELGADLADPAAPSDATCLAAPDWKPLSTSPSSDAAEIAGPCSTTIVADAVWGDEQLVDAVLADPSATEWLDMATSADSEPTDSPVSGEDTWLDLSFLDESAEETVEGRVAARIAGPQSLADELAAEGEAPATVRSVPTESLARGPPSHESGWTGVSTSTTNGLGTSGILIGPLPPSEVLDLAHVTDEVTFDFVASERLVYSSSSFHGDLTNLAELRTGTGPNTLRFSSDWGRFALIEPATGGLDTLDFRNYTGDLALLFDPHGTVVLRGDRGGVISEIHLDSTSIDAIEQIWFSTPFLVSNPHDGAKIRLDQLSGYNNAALTVFGSGHTIHVTDDVIMPAGILFNDSLIIHGNRRLESANGSIVIQNPGTITGNAAGPPDTLTLSSPTGSVTLAGTIGGDGLASVIIADATAATLQDSVTLSAGLSVTTSGPISVQGTVATGSVTLTAGSGDVMIDGPVSTTGGPVALTASSGQATIRRLVHTDGGAVAVTATSTITSTLQGVINTSGTDDPGQDAGPILLHSTGAGAISLRGELVADGGDGIASVSAGGDAGVVTVLNDAGSISVDNIRALGGRGGAGHGSDGIVQLSATTTISQVELSGLAAGFLKLVSTGGDVTLTSPNNLVGTVAASLSGNSSLEVSTSDQLSVGTVAQPAVAAPANLPSVLGVTSTGAGQSVSITTIAGALRVDQPIQTVGGGAISLAADGAGESLLIRANVSSDTGIITLRASGAIDETGGVVSTGVPGAVNRLSDGVASPDVVFSLSGQFDWIEQGPNQTTGGQVLGMTPQGNPVSGAIQTILVNPDDPKIVYAGTVSGGLWKTSDVTATQLVLPISVAKTPAPSVTNVVPAPAAGGALAAGGSYSYRLTFVEGGGIESNPSNPVSVNLAGANRRVSVTPLPVGPVGTTQRRVYRTASGGNTFRLVGTINNNNRNQTFADNVSDAVRAGNPQLEIIRPNPTWEPLTDDFPSLAVGALTFDPDDPNILYMGTGSQSSSNRGGPSVGLFKTTDAGATFEVLGGAEFADLKIRDILTQNERPAQVSVRFDQTADRRRLTVFL